MKFQVSYFNIKEITYGGNIIQRQAEISSDN